MQGHLSCLVARGELREEDAVLIDQFLEYDGKQWGRKKRGTFKRSKREKAVITTQIMARYLSLFARTHQPLLKDATTETVIGALDKYGETRSQNTVRQMVIYLISFLKWFKSSSVDISQIEEMIPPKNWITKQASDMLTGEQVEALIHATTNSRDRALVAVLYEGGFRPVELSRLEWSDVKNDQYGYVVNTSAKTGKPRYVRLITSAPALAQWQQDSHQDTGPVFRGMREGHKNATGITPHAIADIIKKTAKRAGITNDKAVYPYLLRHSRITHLLEDEVHESVIKLQHWGSLSTPMLATYGHISNVAIDRALLENAGTPMEKKTRGKASPRAIQCPACQTINLPGSRWCSQCGTSLTPEAVKTKQAVEKIADQEAENLSESQIERIAVKVIELQKKGKK